MITGELVLPKMDGKEIKDNVFIIGEPTPILQAPTKCALFLTLTAR